MRNRYNYEEKIQEDISRLKAAWEEAISLERFKPGYPDWNGINVLHLAQVPGAQPGITWCHHAFDYVARKLGYDMTPVYRKVPGKNNINWTTPIEIYDNLVSASKINYAISGVREIQKNAAVAYANKGVLIAVATREYVGHLAGIWPSGTHDCIIVNAGSEEVHGIHPFEKVYAPKWNMHPRFFLLRRVKND